MPKFRDLELVGRLDLGGKRIIEKARGWDLPAACLDPRLRTMVEERAGREALEVLSQVDLPGDVRDVGIPEGAVHQAILRCASRRSDNVIEIPVEVKYGRPTAPAVDGQP